MDSNPDVNRENPQHTVTEYIQLLAYHIVFHHVSTCRLPTRFSFHSQLSHETTNAGHQNDKPNVTSGHFRYHLLKHSPIHFCKNGTTLQKQQFC
jgi:hypothetical protein